MVDDYRFITFKTDASTFEQDFTNFLNTKSSESWNVVSCSYCYDEIGKKTYASCIFKRK